MLSVFADLVVCGALDGQTYDYLTGGGRVLWLARHNQFDHEVRTDYLGPALSARGTLVEEHPALGDFPHAGFCDVHFFNLQEASFAIPLPSPGKNLAMLSARAAQYAEPEHLPRAPTTLTPLIWGVESTGNWTQNERLLQRVAWLVEARVGAGALLLCTLNVLDRMDDAYPENVSFFDSLLRYALSNAFQPTGEISPEELSFLLTGYVT